MIIFVMLCNVKTFYERQVSDPSLKKFKRDLIDSDNEFVILDISFSEMKTHMTFKMV